MKSPKTEFFLTVLETFGSFLSLIAIHFILGVTIAKGVIWLLQ